MKPRIISVLFLLATQISFAKVDLPATTMTDLASFAKKNLNEKTDLEEVKKNIEILLVLDEEDPSRTAVMMLSESYNKNKTIYDKAIKAVETKKNKKQLIEIKNILAGFYKNGNG